MYFVFFLDLALPAYAQLTLYVWVKYLFFIFLRIFFKIIILDFRTFKNISLSRVVLTRFRNPGNK